MGHAVFYPQSSPAYSRVSLPISAYPRLSTRIPTYRRPSLRVPAHPLLIPAYPCASPLIPAYPCVSSYPRVSPPIPAAQVTLTLRTLRTRRLSWCPGGRSLPAWRRTSGTRFLSTHRSCLPVHRRSRSSSSLRTTKCAHLGLGLSVCLSVLRSVATAELFFVCCVLP